jgi:hypothetical protein
VQFNNAFFEELGNSAGVVALVKDAAEDIAAAARASAPVDTGEYRDSIHVEVIPNRKTRTVALVVADDPKTMLIEARTGNLARSLRARKKR